MNNMKKILALVMTAVLCLGLLGPACAANNSPEYNAVALMEITFKCGCSWTGMGTMVAENALLTASHNLVCYKHGSENKSVRFYFGYKGRNKYFYRYTGDFNYTYYEDFLNGYRSEDDIAFVIFPTSIGKKTGWYATRYESDEALKWEYSHVIGMKSNSIVDDWNQIDVLSSREISWPLSPSFRGAATGGPVYWTGEGLKYPTLIAVHTTASDSTGYARRLTKDVFDNMKKHGARFN